jgi:hypothetical protein
MGDFILQLMNYATTMFNALIPVGAVTAGISFGIGLVLVVSKLIRGALGGV